MATLDKYLQLSETGQIIIEICLLVQDRTSVKELESIALMSKDPVLSKLVATFSNNDLNGCAMHRFLVHRYAAVEPLEFDREAIFFHALHKPYFKNLCTGYYRFAKDKRYGWSWSWTEHFQVMGNLMRLYVFEEDYIQGNELLKTLFDRVKLDERWMLSDKILTKLFLKGLNIEKFQRIPFPLIRTLLIEDAFSYFFYQMRAPKSFTDYLCDRIHQIKNLGTIQKLTHVLMFKDDRAALEDLVQNAPNLYVMTLAQAQIYFMNGNFEEALKEFDANLQLFKKMGGVKKIAFNTVYFLKGLCLLQQKADKTIWDEYWKILTKDALILNFLSLNLGILSNQARIELINELNRTTDDYIIKNSALHNYLFLAYTSFWSGRQSLGKALLANPIMSEISANYPWIKKEMTALAQLMDADVDKLSQESVLWQIYAPRPDWEIFLEQMDSILNDSALAERVKDERTIWRLDPETLELDPILQKLTKNGHWSKGRTINISKMFEDEIRRQFSNHDLEIALAYFRVLHPNGYIKNIDNNAEKFADLLDTLCGYSLLYLKNSSDTPFHIVKGKMEIRLLKSDKGYHFENPYKGEIYANYFVFKRETATRYTFIRLNREQQQLLQLLEKKDITLPNKAEDLIKKSVKKMATIMPVHSDLIVDDSSIPEHPYDERIYVHILPVGDFFNIELFVKPFGVVPPYFPPGQGHERILAEVEAKTVFVQRNIKAETAAAETLIAGSEILNMDNHDSGIWTLDSIESCLMLLSGLNKWRTENKIVLEWPQGERLKISSYVGFDSMHMNLRSKGDWFEVEGELRINDDLVMDMQMLLERSKASKNRFIALDDGSFLALTESLYRRLQEIESWTKKSKNKLVISRFAGASFSELAEDINFSADAEWYDFIRRMQQANEQHFELPQNLLAELRPYQMEGYQWLQRMAWWGAGACLADDMGLGKTVQTIAVLLSRAADGPALVVAPASVCSNWVSELARFAPNLKAVNLSQVQDRVKSIDDIGPEEVLITTYGLLHQASDALCSKKFNTIVLDEAQSIKNRFTKRSQAAMDLQGNFKIITTGTPIENHLGELWNLFHFINPGLLGTAQMFQERFAMPIEKWADKEKRKHLQKIIRPFILRRLKKEVLKDLPEKTEITLSIERSESETTFYEALRRKALENIQGGKFEHEGAKRMQVLAELMRLRRSCCHPSLIPGGEKIPSAKLEALMELVDELLQNGHKALIFSQFVDYLRIIEKEIKKLGINYQYLDGSTPLKKRKDYIDAFQSGDGDIFLISLKAGGTGLNLTAADYVIHVDPWWNPAVEDQASDRAHRIGQQNPVTVYRLVAEGSIEEKIVKLHGSKREMAEALLQETDGKVTMNADELLDLLKNY